MAATPVQEVNVSTNFETSKQEFIQNVRQSYEKFLKEHGVDLENEIRKKVLKEIKQKKADKKSLKQKNKQEAFRLTRIGIVSDMLCELEYKFSDKINEFYGDLSDVEIISEWYYTNCNVTIDLVWYDNTLRVTNNDGKLNIRGGTKELRKFIKSDKVLIREFIDASDEYYYLNDEYYQ
jgi:hypothetical protein